MELFVIGSSQTKSVTFSTWALSFLEMYKKPYVEANTYSGTYLYPTSDPYFGNMNLDDIRLIHIQ